MTRVSHGRRWQTARMLVAATVAAAAMSVVVAVSSPPAGAADAYSNGKLVTTVYNSAYEPDIWVMNPDGTNPVNLTDDWMHSDGSPSSESAPVWSPDGKYIALQSTRGTAPPNTRDAIWIMNADGSNARNLTEISGGILDRDPAWSPDGMWIAFDRDGLHKVRTDGSDLTKLTSYTSLSVDLAARWSPDGTEIAYISNPIGGEPDKTGLSFVQPDGGGQRYVGPVTATQPRWSTSDPDVLAYTDCFNCGTSNIRKVNRNGSGDAVLIADAQGAVWSPDGSTMLFSRSQGVQNNREVFKLYAVPTAGGPEVEIPLPFDQTQNSVSTFWDWQPLPAPAGTPVVGLVDPGQGLWHLFDDAGVEVSSFFFGNPGDFPIVGDWDCDGVETPGMYRQSDGYVYLRNSNTQGAGEVRFFFGDPGDVPIAGDFNKDGCDTVSIYRPANQTFYIINELGKNDGGLGAAEFSYVFGDPGDKPFVGDFDGDGVETVGLHRESTGLVYFRNSHTQGVADAQFIFGDPDDRLVAGDWNNDGKYSPALFRPSNTTMFFRYTNTQGNADNQFIPAGSQAPWLPVAGVFD